LKDYMLQAPGSMDCDQMTEPIIDFPRITQALSGMV